MLKPFPARVSDRILEVINSFVFGLEILRRKKDILIIKGYSLLLWIVLSLLRLPAFFRLWSSLNPPAGFFCGNSIDFRGKYSLGPGLYRDLSLGLCRRVWLFWGSSPTWPRPFRLFSGWLILFPSPCWVLFCSGRKGCLSGPSRTTGFNSMSEGRDYCLRRSVTSRRPWPIRSKKEIAETYFGTRRELEEEREDLIRQAKRFKRPGSRRCRPRWS